MKICISYSGQPRMLDHAKRTFDSLFAPLSKSGHECHVMYTTWDHTNVEKYVALFPMAHVRQVAQPKDEVYEAYERNFRQLTFQHTMTNYMLGLYIRKETVNTINQYEAMHHIDFDVIISLRTDTLIQLDRSIEWCCEQAMANGNSIFVGDRERFDVTGRGACPDMFIVASKGAALKCLNQHDHIEGCSFIYEGEKTVHPETSCYLNFKQHGCNVVYVPGSCFVDQSDRHLYTQPNSYNESVYRKYRQ